MLTPIDQLDRRLPELGRIRTGTTIEGVTKAGKPYSRPTASDTFILTSSRVDALEALAAVYGGVVEPWTTGNADKSADTHILVTETDTLSVLLHADAMRDPRYELWVAGTCTRRCDGVTVVGRAQRKDGSYADPMEMACLCNAPGAEVKCKPKAHLSVLFPESPVGVWRLVTSSANALLELQASIEVIRLAEQVGLPKAQLKIDRRKGSDGQRFSVPVLTSASSVGELLDAASGGTVAEVESGRAALPAVVVDEEDVL